MENKTLEQLIEGSSTNNSRIIFYADPGFGKSTLGALLENPIFIRTEEGRINAKRFPVRFTFGELISDIKTLIDEPHDFKTIVLDGWDGAERFGGDQVAKENSVEAVTDIDWGKGPPKLVERMRLILRGLDKLQQTRNMNVVLLSHVHICKVKSPMSEGYDKFSPAINREVGEVLEAWADAILFGQFKTVVTTSKTDKRGKAISDGSRIIYAQSRPAFVAKNRYNLSEKLEVETPEDILNIFNTINKG